jgi:ubiquitin carboxyl-terminal hydrolase 5/13
LRRTFAEEELDIVNPNVPANGGRVSAVCSTGIKTFPRYLVIKLQRYYVDESWKQRKIDATILMPEALDLSNLHSRGPQPGEELIPDASSIAASSAAPAAEDIGALEAHENELTMQLVSMGFSENGCRRAARAVGRNADAEVAMNWILEHMDDANFNDPVPPLAAEIPAAVSSTTGPAYDPSTVETLMSFGFPEDRVKRALRETDFIVERFRSSKNRAVK